MHHEPIAFRGTYCYATVAELERALGAARACIAEDDHAELDPDWARTFARVGTKLRVDVVLPASADRFVAAAVLEALATPAVEGVVEASRGGCCVDWFPAGR